MSANGPIPDPNDPVPECCSTGHIHAGSPKGTTMKLGPREAYVVDPVSGRTDKVILYIVDVFGWELVNSRLLADKIAELSGYTVVMPDILTGPALPDETGARMIAVQEATGLAKLWSTFSLVAAAPTLIGFFSRNTDGTVLPLLQGAIKELKETWGVKKIGAVGYCFGGRYTVLLGGGDEPLVDAVIGVHPSRVIIPSDVEKLKKPTLFLLAEVDFALDEKVRKNLVEVMKKNKECVYEQVCYPATTHGFAVRGDE
eukprot:comp6037_c0_seq1/m.1881 comp6037_c0_seq1/g.1881  ORF comp6037_c0_seq1/g.1881 comp6037_c0_seq1/m.1881 type:complete len:256 (-) comp6037_c0_seq1:312-1079(-)